MPYFKRKQDQEQEPERLFVRPVEDDFEEDDPGDYAGDDLPEDEPVLTDTEARRENSLRVAAGISDFLGVFLGAVAILVLLAVLISLINWVYADVTQFFSLWMDKV